MRVKLSWTNPATDSIPDKTSVVEISAITIRRKCNIRPLMINAKSNTVLETKQRRFAGRLVLG